MLQSTHHVQWLAAGAALAFLSVMLGAFGAHALKNALTTEQLQTFDTGVRYHMYHAIALMICGLLHDRYPRMRYLNLAAWQFAAGILIFSGSLYLYALTGTRTLVMLTPVGGMLFLSGWVSLLIALFKSRRSGV